MRAFCFCGFLALCRFRIFIDRDDVHGYVAGGEIEFEPGQHAPAIDVRQVDIECHGYGLKVAHDRYEPLPDLVIARVVADKVLYLVPVALRTERNVKSVPIRINYQ